MIKGLEALTYFKTLFDIWKEKIAVADDTKEIEEEYEFKPRYELIEKELKALEIIKGFRKDKYSTMEIYGNDIVMNVYLTLDDNEIDLLKEVLL